MKQINNKWLNALTIAGTCGACNGAVKKRGLILKLWTGKGHLTSKHKYFDNNFKHFGFIMMNIIKIVWE